MAVAHPPKRQEAPDSATPRASAFLVAFVISLILPIFYHVGPLRMAPFLILLIVGFFPLLVLWASRFAGPVILPDFLILFVCFWATLALIRSHGLTRSIEPAGIVWVQTLGSYLVGRVLVRNARQAITVLLIYAVIAIILFPFALYESVTDRPLYLDLFANVGSTYLPARMDPRWGLSRAQAAFEHPILFGVFAVSLFSLLFYHYRQSRGKLLLLAALLAVIGSGVFSLSTGALLALVVQCGLMGWNWIFQRTPRKWTILMVLVGLAYVAIDLVSTRTPFHVFVQYLTFSSHSSYHRINIWNYGTAEVLRHRWFGIGQGEWEREWWMPSSIDNFWLVIAIRYGLPAILALAAAFVIIAVRVGNARCQDRTEEYLRKGILISLTGVWVAISSVHLWNATYSWMMFLVGSSVWLATSSSTSRPVQRSPLVVSARSGKPSTHRRRSERPPSTSAGERSEEAAIGGDHRTHRVLRRSDMRRTNMRP